MRAETTRDELLRSDCVWCRKLGHALERAGVHTVGEYDALPNDEKEADDA